jgi:competence protein ComGC
MINVWIAFFVIIFSCNHSKQFLNYFLITMVVIIFVTNFLIIICVTNMLAFFMLHFASIVN